MAWPCCDVLTCTLTPVWVATVNCGTSLKASSPVKSTKKRGDAAVELWSKLTVARPLPSIVSSAACNVVRFCVGLDLEKSMRPVVLALAPVPYPRL